MEASLIYIMRPCLHNNNKQTETGSGKKRWMPQQVKALAAMPEALNSILKTETKEQDPNSCKVSSDLYTL